MGKANKMTTETVVKPESVVLPKTGKVTIIGTGGGLKGEYLVSTKLAETLIKKEVAKLKS